MTVLSFPSPAHTIAGPTGRTWPALNLAEALTRALIDQLQAQGVDTDLMLVALFVEAERVSQEKYGRPLRDAQVQARLRGALGDIWPSEAEGT